MHLSPSRITGYWPKGGDKPTCRCEDNRRPGGSLPPGAWLLSPAGKSSFVHSVM